ncbi:putative reverse transcriptase domain-containing protein [Tanacetum coccineum]
MEPKKRTTRASPATTTTTTFVTNAQVKALIDKGVADALAARDADRSMNGDDNYNSRTSVRRNERVVRECTYPDFMKCQPLNFKGTKGVVELSQWLEKMETMFGISNCSVENQIKFSTCTLLGSALTWWNSHVRTVGHDVAYAMSWVDLKKKMTDKSGERKEYVETLPLCNKCEFHHNGQCTVKCVNCKRVGHLTQDCRSLTATNNQRNTTCYEYGNQGHYRSDCPKLKNQNHGNQTGGIGARRMVHALGGREIN